jgi:hypothetical protein
MVNFIIGQINVLSGCMLSALYRDMCLQQIVNNFYKSPVSCLQLQPASISARLSEVGADRMSAPTEFCAVPKALLSYFWASKSSKITGDDAF